MATTTLTTAQERAYQDGYHNIPPNAGRDEHGVYAREWLRGHLDAQQQGDLGGESLVSARLVEEMVLGAD